VDFGLLARLAGYAGADRALTQRIAVANTALDALTLSREAGVALGDAVASAARTAAVEVLRGSPVEVDIVVIDRAGVIVGRA
jgi:cobalt-precorrin-5B (C1)-methyltransferase